MEQNKLGSLFLIPCPIIDDGINQIPMATLDRIKSIKFFIAEHAKTCRRYLKSVHPEIQFDEIEIFELNKRTEDYELSEMIQVCLNGNDIGLISDAGCPGVADPGAVIVDLAHQKKITVEPLVGPSSILLALMASGMNGQGFQFHGYLSPKRPLLSKDLKKLERLAKESKHTQIFIETPYRNLQVFEEACKHLQKNTKLCIACDIGYANAFIKTKSIAQWKKTAKPDLHKRPAVFLIGNS
ncbi:MAG: SAM-dependent methyltransferase [Bacteroidota bacterium]